VKRIVVSLVCVIVGSILLQNFQCSTKSALISSAEMEYNKKNYEKAEDYVNKEFVKDKQSKYGYLLLSKVKLALNQPILAVRALKKLEPLIGQDKKLKEDFAIQSYYTWQGCYKSGGDYYNKFGSTSDKLYLDSSLAFYQAGNDIRPEIPDFYSMMASIYDRKGMPDSALAMFVNLVNRLSPTYDFFVENNIVLNASIPDVQKILGKPLTTNIDSLEKKDKKDPAKKFQRTDKYNIKGKDVFVHFYKDITKDAKKDFELKGIVYDPPKDWLEQERSVFYPFDLDPYLAAANYYNQKKDFDNTIMYLQKALKLSPENTDINSSLTQMYQVSGKGDVALKAIEENIKKFPDNKVYYFQYGDMLSRTEKFNEAITYYEKALAIDPDYDMALYNIAAALKNRASVAAKQEDELASKNPGYPRKTERYFPDLNKSAEYFDKVSNTKKFKDDLGALSELANIYQVLNDLDRVKKIVERLEAIEYDIDDNNKERYLLLLLKIYSDLKMDDKSTETENKLKEIKK